MAFPDEFGAHGDVSPLVRASDLSGATVALVELGKVIGLEQHVGKLRVGDSLIRALKSRLY